METGEKCIIADSIQQTVFEKVIHLKTYTQDYGVKLYLQNALTKYKVSYIFM